MYVCMHLCCIPVLKKINMTLGSAHAKFSNKKKERRWCLSRALLRCPTCGPYHHEEWWAVRTCSRAEREHFEGIFDLKRKRENNGGIIPKSIILVCNEIHLIKIIPSMKEILYRKMHRTKQILSRCYFSSSNAYAGQNSKFRKYSDNSSEIQNT